MTKAPTFVVLVEDDFLVRSVFDEELTEAGFKVLAFDNGISALAKIEADPSRIQALITDIRLGGEPGGWDVAKRAREFIHSIPVIYITADSEEQWPIEGVPKSVLLIKPFAAAQLLTALSTLLNELNSQPR